MAARYHEGLTRRGVTVMDTTGESQDVRFKDRYREPSLETLSKAISMVDRMTAGDRLPGPESAIDNGLRIHLRMRKDDGYSFRPQDREPLVKAVARALDRDDEAPKSHLGSYAAAKVISLDMSLQRDMSAIVDLDAVDREDMLKRTELTARGAHWAGLQNASEAIRFGSQDDLAALAKGDFHEASTMMSVVVKAGMEASDLVGIRDLDLKLLRAARVMEPEEVAEFVRTPRMTEQQDVRLRQISSRMRKMDRVSFPKSSAVFRETEFETRRIARRTGRALEVYYMATPPAAPKADVDRIMLDSRFSDPETEEGKVVKAAREELDGIGLGGRTEGPGFEAAVSRMIAMGAADELKAGKARVVSDVIVQHEAVRMLEAAEDRGRPFRDRPAAPYISDESDHLRKYVVHPLTSSPRDIEDLRKVSVGDFASVSTDTGMRNSLRIMLDDAGKAGHAEARADRRSIEAAHASDREETPAVDMARVSRMVKGPAIGGPRMDLPDRAQARSKGPEAGSSVDWVARMAGKGGGRGD